VLISDHPVDAVLRIHYENGWMWWQPLVPASSVERSTEFHRLVGGSTVNLSQKVEIKWLIKP
jgi:hypothetical protein